MKVGRFPIPIRVLIAEIPAMLLGMAGFAVIITIVVSLLFTLWQFVFGNRNWDSLPMVAIATFSICFVAYVVLDFSSKKEGLLRRFILLRRSGETFFREGDYDKAVSYLEESIRILQIYDEPQYDFLLEQANSVLKQAIERQEKARQIR